MKIKERINFLLQKYDDHNYGKQTFLDDYDAAVA